MMPFTEPDNLDTIIGLAIEDKVGGEAYDYRPSEIHLIIST
jgi:hypothetical protein